MNTILKTTAFCLLLSFASCKSKVNSSSDTQKTTETTETFSGLRTVDVNEFKNALAQEGSISILDVRTPDEFKRGFIDGAKNINFYDTDFKDQLAKLDKSIPVLVYCKSGGRSGSAAKILQNAGFTSVTDLKGGLLNWQANGGTLAGVATKAVTGYTKESYFEVINSHDLVLVDFFAPWCGPCKKMAPDLLKVKNAYTEKLKVFKVDTDQSQALAQYFKISGIPLIKVYSKGKEMYSQGGQHSEAQLLAAIKPYL